MYPKSFLGFHIFKMSGRYSWSILSGGGWPPQKQYLTPNENDAITRAGASCGQNELIIPLQNDMMDSQIMLGGSRPGPRTLFPEILILSRKRPKNRFFFFGLTEWPKLETWSEQSKFTWRAGVWQLKFADVCHEHSQGSASSFFILIWDR